MENERKNNNLEGLRKYGVYSSVVFQMLFIIGISFWGGNRLNEYLGYTNQLLTVVIGFAGLCFSMYTTLKRLEAINKKEEKK